MIYTPYTKESLRFQAKVMDVIDYIEDHFKAWLYTWIIIAGILTDVLRDPPLFWYLAGGWVLLLIFIAFLIWACAFISKILSL